MLRKLDIFECFGCVFGIDITFLAILLVLLIFFAQFYTSMTEQKPMAGIQPKEIGQNKKKI